MSSTNCEFLSQRVSQGDGVDAEKAEYRAGVFFGLKADALGDLDQRRAELCVVAGNEAEGGT